MLQTRTRDAITARRAAERLIIVSPTAVVVVRRGGAAYSSVKQLTAVEGRSSLQLVVGSISVLALILDPSTVHTARLQKLGHAFQCPLSVVVDHLVVALLEELDGGEALDLDDLDLVGGGVHLGDNDGLAVLKVFAELVVDGLERLAVSAPGGVELHEDVLV